MSRPSSFRIPALLLSCVFFAPLHVGATDYTSAGFIERDPVFTVTGGESSSASFRYISAVGETDIGENVGTSITHRAWFLYFNEAAVTPPTPPPPTPTPGGGAVLPPGLIGKIKEIPKKFEDLFPKPKCAGRGDLNGDCRVDLVDFSIAAYWYKQKLSDTFAIKEKECLNGDGKLDMTDFSIMAFNWTG